MALGTVNPETVEISDEERATREAKDARLEERNKFLMNYFLTISFGGVMAALGAVIGFGYPQFF